MDVSAVGRLLLSLAMVLGLMWLIARRVRRRSGTGRRQSRVVDVLARQQISRNVSVAVIRVVDRTLVVGISDGGVSMLAEADSAAVAAALEQQGNVARPAKAARAPRSSRSPSVAVIDGRVVRLPQNPDSHSDAAEGQRTPAPRAATEQPRTSPLSGSALQGSALSPATWRQAFTSVRELTTRAR
jgi:flagellar protein FliO/FliZ